MAATLVAMPRYKFNKIEAVEGQVDFEFGGCGMALWRTPCMEVGRPVTNVARLGMQIGLAV
ncbi:MAG: hypothetical protein ACTSX7_17880 [Alphaproteobacteria bacterium]